MKYLHIITVILAGGIGITALSAVIATTITYQAPYLPTVAHATYENEDTTRAIVSSLQIDAEISTSTEQVVHNVKSEVTSQKKVAANTQKTQTATTNKSVLIVPFYSQFTDITSTEWKKVGCGIASLAMLIDYYNPNPPSVDTLLQEGIKSHAYLSDAGWTYAGLIGVSKKYGLDGESHDLSSATMDSAFNSLQESLANGPVMVSIHYKFEPENPIPHLVVANGVRDDMLYYNDPAAKTGNLSIPVSTFKKAWKKRYIEIRPIS